MSAVFGFWNLDGRPAEPARLVAMSAVLAHRGPDGWDGWCQGPVGIGHRMLRTTPESLHERQPMMSRDGTRVLAADLRLDNRDDLIRRFALRDRPSERLSDAEVLFRAYEACGRDSAKCLLGAFAFVVWDERARELLCVRDHFGEKPLYYFHAPGRVFAFASEIKALLVLDGVPDDVDELEVARHLLIPVPEDPGATYYRAVRRLLPAHTLAVTPGGVEERQYWALDPTRSLFLSSDEEYAQAVREAFIEAVRCRLRTSGPVASLLSGGLDSSAVTCVAARLLGESGNRQPLRALSAIYPDVPTCDERPFIAKVLEAYDLEPGFFRLDRVSPIADIHRLNWHGDGANKGGNLYLEDNLYRMASAVGARVVLDGFDGDSTVSHGRGWLVELAETGRWWTLAREVKTSAKSTGEPWTVALRSWIIAYGVKRARQRLSPLRRLSSPWARNGAGSTRKDELPRWARGVAPEFRRRISGQIAPPPARPRTEKEHHYRLMTRPILLQGLSWLEATGAAAGVEVRFPFFDVRLVQLCLSLPPEQKLRRGLSRFVMRQAMAGIVPEEVRRRRDKADLTPGFLNSFRSYAGDDVRIALSHAEGSASRYVDPAFCMELHYKLMAGSLPSADVYRCWLLVSLALWLVRRAGANTARGPGGLEGFVRAPRPRAPRGQNHQEEDHDDQQEGLPVAVR